MVAVARPREESESQPQSTRQELFTAFDSMLALSGIGAALTLFEREHPGALAALRSWSSAHEIRLVERPIVDRPDCYVLGTDSYEVAISIHAEHTS